jgi:intermembrane space import and assembly protein 40
VITGPSNIIVINFLNYFTTKIGPTKPDGSVNFECHCVSHLVASPCGYAFRKAITCQKSASDEELEKGACADEFMELMECAMRTQCFRSILL